MPAKEFPNLGLKAGYTPGENGWAADMTLNMLKLSVLTQGTVVSKVSEEPASPTDGDVHILDELHPTQANKVIVRDEGAWLYITPDEGWLLYDKAGDVFLKFDGTEWDQLATAGGGGGGGALSLIGYIESDGTRTLFEFANIPQGYKDIEIRMHGRLAAVAAQAPVVRVNGLSTAQYDYQRQYSLNATNTANQGIAQTSWQNLFAWAGTGQSAGLFTPVRAEILDYSKAGVQKSIMGTCRYPAGANDGYILDFNGHSRDTAVISSFTVDFGANATAAGSFVALYGRAGSGDEIFLPDNGVGELTVEAAPASFVLAMTDRNKYRRITAAAANTVTVPPHSTVAFPIGTQIHLVQAGVGQTTIVAGTGVSINTAETLKLRKLYSSATLVKVAENEWDLAGDLELLP